MSDRFAAEERQLCEQFASAARGPKRNGLFALWLLLRVAGDLYPPHPVSDRAHRRRVDALVKRLTSLTLPGALSGPLREAARAMGDQPRSGVDLRSSVAPILGGLVPTIRDALGPHAASAVATAARLSSEA